MCTYNTCLSDGQQDAQEAYHAIVHSLSSEEAKRRKNSVLETFGVVRATFKDLSRDKKKKVADYAALARSGTFIDHLFSGTTMNQITCLTCGSVTKTLDCFVDLSVPLPKKKEKSWGKQKASNDTGMSKHQKKKQQKDNRKGKKGKERRSSTSMTQPIETTEMQSIGDVLSHSPALVPLHGIENGVEAKVETLSEDGGSMVTVPKSPSASEAIEIDDILVDCENENNKRNGVVDLNSVVLAVDDEVEANGGVNNQVSNWLEHLVEDPSDDHDFDMNDRDDLVIEGKMVEFSGDTPDLCDKMDKLEIDSSITKKLNGGTCYGVTPETGSNDGDMFSGLFEQPSEDHDSHSSDVHHTMEDLNLDTSECVGDTLEACIAEFCSEELLDGDNQFSCMNCARKTTEWNSLNVSCAKSNSSSFSGEEDNASKSSEEGEEIKPVLRDAKCRYFLNSLPPILVIHMKRFSANNRGLLQKDRRHMNYPLDLELDKFVLNGGSGNRYKLFGVVDHSGSLHRGHYIAYVRKRDTALDFNFKNETIPLSAQIKLLGQMNSERTKEKLDKWYCCNDERVSEVPVKRVLNADAYLLFYERVLPYS